MNEVEYIVCEECSGSGFDGYGTGYSEVCSGCTGGYVGIKYGKDDEKMNETTFVFLDLETTGLTPEDNHITQIGAIKTDKHGNELSRFTRYVKVPEGFVISDFIKDYTGIDNELLDREGIHPLVAMGMLHEFIDDAIVVAQFAPFDLSFVEKSFPVENFICTRTMSYEINPKLKAGLKDIATRCNINMGKHHSAIDDANTAKEAFFFMDKMLYRIPEKNNATGLINVVGQSNQRKISYHPSAMVELREY